MEGGLQRIPPPGSLVTAYTIGQSVPNHGDVSARGAIVLAGDSTCLLQTELSSQTRYTLD